MALVSSGGERCTRQVILLRPRTSALQEESVLSRPDHNARVARLGQVLRDYPNERAGKRPEGVWRMSRWGRDPHATGCESLASRRRRVSALHPNFRFGLDLDRDVERQLGHTHCAA